MSVHIILRLYCEYLISNNHKIPIYLYTEQHIESSGTPNSMYQNTYDERICAFTCACVYVRMDCVCVCVIASACIVLCYITIHVRINAYKSMLYTHVPRFMGKIALLLMVDSDAFVPSLPPPPSTPYCRPRILCYSSTG